MPATELYRHFQQRQRELAGRELRNAEFEFLLSALKRDFDTAVSRLDELNLKILCDTLGAQLEHEIQFAGSGQRRKVIAALLRCVENIEYQHQFR